MSGYVKVFHCACFAESIFALVVFYHFTGRRVNTYGGDWKYLTYLNLIVKAVCFTLFCIDDVLTSLCTKYSSLKRVQHITQRIKTTFYSTIALPSALLVFIMFWGMFIVDRELVYPKHFDKLFPVWANHVWHSGVLTVVIEAVLVKHPYPSYRTSLIISNITSLSYVLWVLWVEKVGGVVIYPFLGKLHGIWFALFVVAEFALVQALFQFGKCLNNFTIGFDGGRYLSSKEKIK